MYILGYRQLSSGAHSLLDLKIILVVSYPFNLSSAKLQTLYEILTVKRGDPAKFRLRSPHLYHLIIVKVC